MNSTTIIVGGVGFVLGTVVGVLGSWKYITNKANKIIDEELSYQQSKNKKEDEPIVKPTSPITPDEATEAVKTEYNDVLKKCNYANAGASEDKKKMSKKNKKTPASNVFIITGEAFGENDYEVVSLELNGGVLTEYDGEIVDIDTTIGRENCTHIETTKQEVTYIRNHNNKTDYDVTLVIDYDDGYSFDDED